MNDPTVLIPIAVVLSITSAALLVSFRRGKGQSLRPLTVRAKPAAPAPRTVRGRKPKKGRTAPSPAAEENNRPSPAEGGQLEAGHRQLAGILIFMGFAFGLLSLSLRKDLPAANPSAYLPFLVLGLLFFMGGMYFSSRLTKRGMLDSALEWIAWKMDIRPAQFVCLLGGILLAVLATVAAGTHSLMISPTVSIVSWLAGIVLTVLGGWRFTSSEGKSPIPRNALAWAAGLTLAAFLLRAVLAGQIPVMLTGDEGATGLDALQFRAGTIDNPFGIFGWHPFPSMYFFIESVGIAIFGRTAAALRYPSAVAGALSVGGLYLLVRSMYSHRHGLAAAVFLSALHLHMHFSRMGVMNVWDGLWYLMVLGGLWYGWHTGKRSYWILAGLALGFGQYFYATTRILFAVVPLWLLAATAFDRDGWRRNRRNLVPALAAFIAAVLPLLWYAGTNFDRYQGDVRKNSILGPWMEFAVQQTGLPAWRILLKQLGLGFGGFISVNLGWFYRPQVPILRTLPAVFFVFGLGILILRLRRTRTWIPLLWLAAYGTAVSLSESAPAAQRFAGVGPACALVVGFGVVEITSICMNLFTARKWIVNVAAAALIGFMAVDDLHFYFFTYTPQSVYQGRYDFVGRGGEVARELVRQLAERPGPWQVVFLNNKLMGFFSDPALRFLSPNVEGMDVKMAWGSPDNLPIPDGNLFIVIMPGREEEIPLIRTDYPGGTLAEVYAPDGSVLYTYYEFRRET
ncbi:MAG: ArnT family glycosyltransferase [Anaerolineales bacterium]